jgi:hypothetical protein
MTPTHSPVSSSRTHSNSLLELNAVRVSSPLVELPLCNRGFECVCDDSARSGYESSSSSSSDVLAGFEAERVALSGAVDVAF